MAFENLAYELERRFPNCIHIKNAPTAKAVSDHIEQFPTYGNVYLLSERIPAMPEPTHQDGFPLPGTLSGREIKTNEQLDHLASVVRELQEMHEVQIEVRAYMVWKGKDKRELQIEIGRHSIQDRHAFSVMNPRTWLAAPFHERKSYSLEGIHNRMQLETEPRPSNRTFYRNNAL